MANNNYNPNPSNNPWVDLALKAFEWYLKRKKK